MKRILLALVIAVMAVMLLATSVLAAGGADADVTLSDITITEGTEAGVPVTASGTVTISAEAWTNYFLNSSIATSEAGAAITDSYGNTLFSDSNSEFDIDAGLRRSDADACQTLDWSYTFVPSEGAYTFSQWGEAYAAFIALFRFGSDSDCQSMSIRRYFRGDNDVWANTGEFELCVNGTVRAYSWVGGGLSKAVPAITQEGYLNGKMIRAVIDEGTEVSASGTRVNQVELRVIGNALQGYTLSVNPSAVKFSKPVKVYELIDGKWVLWKTI